LQSARLVAAVAELGSRLHYAHRVSEALYNAIAARYGFAIPDEYRRLESRGLFTLSAAAHASTFYRPDSYLWLHDMEWYSPQAILDFEFEPYHLPGFVPFAFTGGGDYWCWHPAHADRRGAHVLCCCHDCELATIYAPNFHTALYRQILDFCVGSSEDEDIDSSASCTAGRQIWPSFFPILGVRACASWQTIPSDQSTHQALSAPTFPSTSWAQRFHGCSRQHDVL